VTWRFLPSDFELKTHLTRRYGEKFLPEGHDDPGLGRYLIRSRYRAITVIKQEQEVWAQAASRASAAPRSRA
jgi:hypothetical protein